MRLRNKIEWAVIKRAVRLYVWINQTVHRIIRASTLTATIDCVMKLVARKCLTLCEAEHVIREVRTQLDIDARTLPTWGACRQVGRA